MGIFRPHDDIAVGIINDEPVALAAVEEEFLAELDGAAESATDGR
jgi:hypothetical protein